MMSDSQNKGFEFEQKVAKMIDTTMCGMALAMAHQVGIIEALTETETPRASQEVADAKNLKERYVREILNSLACSQIVHVQRKDRLLLYHIPRDQWSAFDDKNARYLPVIASTATRFQGVKECILKDGPYGLPYGDNLVTYEAQERESTGRVDRDIQFMLDKVPGLRHQLESGIDVIELGSGSATLISELARRFPRSRFIGSDYSEFVVENAQKSVASRNLQNVTIERLDILDIPSTHASRYDFAFVNDVIHDLPDPEGGFAGMHKVLKPGCYLAVIDVVASSDVVANCGKPSMAVAYSASTFHCIPQAYQSANSKPHGCCWGLEVATQYLERQGFKIVDQHQYLDIFVFFVCQKN